MIPTFILLALSVCSVWTKDIKLSNYSVPLWIIFLAAALASGVVHHYVEWIGVAWIVIFALFAFATPYTAKHRFVYALHLVIIGVMALLLGMGKLPGFHNPNIVTNLQFTPDGLPFTQRLRIDGVSVGIILLALFCEPVKTWSEWMSVLRKSVPIILVTLVIIFSIGLITHYVSVDLKFVPYTFVFLIANLLFTCVMEESFFRGFIQGNLTRLLSGLKYGAPCAVVITAVLFGLVHFAGGLLFIGLATVAGLCYGYALYRVKHIEAAILTHFSVNAVHVIAFTYPNY